MNYPRLRGDRLAACLDDAAASPMAAPGLEIPDWYRVRWHFLPEGYLSRRSVAAYDALIPRLYNTLMPGHADAAILRELWRERSGSVLHVGCGPGRLLARLARGLPGTRLHGVDLSPFMLERARDRLRGVEDRVELQHADATALPLDPGRLDAVVMLHFLGHIPADTAGICLTEAARMLDEGGVLVTLDHRWHPSAPVPPTFILARQRRLFGGLQVLSVYRRTAGYGASGMAD